MEGPDTNKQRGALKRPAATAGKDADRARFLAALCNVLCRWALLPFDDVEFYGIPLGKRLEAVARDCAVMDEAVLLPIVRSDEAKAFRIVEPFYLAGRTHSCSW